MYLYTFAARNKSAIMSAKFIFTAVESGVSLRLLRYYLRSL